jgi:hypothetical protein
MFNVCNIVPACTRELDGLRHWGVGEKSGRGFGPRPR